MDLFLMRLLIRFNFERLVIFIFGILIDNIEILLELSLSTDEQGTLMILLKAKGHLKVNQL